MEPVKGWYMDEKDLWENTPDAEKELFKRAITDFFATDNPDEGYKAQKYITGIEIGVLNGETSRFFLGNWDNLLLFGIDPIIPDSMSPELVGSEKLIMKNVKAVKALDRFKFLKDYSTAVAPRFKHEEYDFVFIDGSHVFGDVVADFQSYFPKVKKGGLIFFHDSRMNRGGANFHVGSSMVVDHIIANNREVNLIGEAFSLTCFYKLTNEDIIEMEEQ